MKTILLKPILIIILEKYIENKENYRNAQRTTKKNQNYMY